MRTPAVKKVIHPIFISLAEFTLDGYWKQVLLDCSVGKFPRYICYKDNLFLHRRGKVSSNVPLYPEDTGAEDFKRVIGFLRGLGMASVLDNENNQKRLQDQQSLLITPIYKEWKDVKIQSAKDSLIRAYINELHQELELTVREYNILQATISIALLFKYINSSTVKMTNGKISQFVGMKMETDPKGQRNFSFPDAISDSPNASPALSIREECEPVDQSKILAALWAKHLEDLRRRNEFYSNLPVL